MPVSSWEGLGLLDAIRSDTVWEKTKKRFSDEGISMTVDLVKGVAKGIVATILNAA